MNTEKLTLYSKIKNTSKVLYLFKWIALLIGIIGVLVSSIVDIVINRKLTWSLIGDVAVAFIFILVATPILCKKNKLIITSLVSSILVFPLLLCIEHIVNKNFIANPRPWFKTYAFPITLIWLGVIWSLILIKKWMSLNFWHTLSFLFILVMVGSTFTNVIARKVSVFELYKGSFKWIDSMVYFLCAIACFIIGKLDFEKFKTPD